MTGWVLQGMRKEKTRDDKVAATVCCYGNAARHKGMFPLQHGGILAMATSAGPG
jgi:hypothetical protein